MTPKVLIATMILADLIGYCWWALLAFMSPRHSHRQDHCDRHAVPTAMPCEMKTARY